MKKWMLFLVALLTLTTSLCAQSISPDIAGIWNGRLPLPAVRIVLTVSRGDSGSRKAVMYSVSQQGQAYRVNAITLAASTVKFSIDALHGEYTGTLNAEGTLITGDWTQRGTQHQFNLRRAFVTARITGEQLEQTLSAARGEPDGKVAARLSRTEVSDRLSAATLARCEAYLTGPRAKEALLALADQSAFLDPPAAEMPALPMPDAESRQAMMALTVSYVTKAIHQLPNLFATRTTSTFQDDLQIEKPLHPAGRYKASILYRNGDESLHPQLFQSKPPGMTTSGEFGPVLGTALLDAAQGKLVWSHWEQGLAGPEAVFRYVVTADRSHYMVEQQAVAYEGEIAIDPGTGTIFRLVLRGDVESINPKLSAEILVEYGPVELGGKTYICPLKSVAFSQELVLGWLNHVVFDQYHVYHATARILPGETP
jgi:hypothetical protein